MRVSTNEKFADEVTKMAAAYSNNTSSEPKIEVKLSAGALAGIIIGSVCCLCLFVLCAAFAKRLKQMKDANSA